MPDSPEIDVLIPAYNAEKTIAASLESICKQTISDYRIVIVDDGSTDATPAIIENFQSGDGRISYLRKPNGGVAQALNHGLAQCTAPYVARFDADDLCYPNRLEVQRAYLAANPDCVAVGSDVDHIDAVGNPVPGLPRPGDPALADMDWVPAREPYLIHPFLFARRMALVEAGGYRQLRTSQDSDLYWRLEKLGRLHNLPERLGQYRLHDDSISGGSVHSGRIMAIFSQLAALSSRRARDGMPDLEFPLPDEIFTPRDRPLAEMVDAVSVLLSAVEATHFRVAVGAKLFELSGYRGFDPTPADGRFFREAFAGAGYLSAPNAKALHWHMREAAARLLSRGRLSEAMAMVGPGGFPRALIRLGLHLTGVWRLS